MLNLSSNQGNEVKRKYYFIESIEEEVKHTMKKQSNKSIMQDTLWDYHLDSTHTQAIKDILETKGEI